MKIRNYKYHIRKIHRFLGLFLGIQFMFWTLGGLYFSWTNIKEIRGDHLRKDQKTMRFDHDFIAPKIVIEEIKKNECKTEIKALRLIEILDEPFYEIKCESTESEKLFAVNAVSGKVRQSISEDEAKKIAIDGLKQSLSVKNVQYLTKENVGGHHEYREKPLPAWAVTFENSEDLTVYLSAETGQIGAFRTKKWRIFDFLWMLHTMDFEERDNINNYLLRGFSLMGIVTIISGFLLFLVSSKFLRKLFSIKTKVPN